MLSDIELAIEEEGAEADDVDEEADEAEVEDDEARDEKISPIKLTRFMSADGPVMSVMPMPTKYSSSGCGGGCGRCCLLSIGLLSWLTFA